MPSSSTPGSTSIATAAAPGATPAANLAALTTADFLNLLAGMIGATPAPAPQSTVAPQTPAPKTQVPLNLAELPTLAQLTEAADLPELPESEPSREALPEEETDDDDSPSDAPATIAALPLPILPLAVMTGVVPNAPIEITADGDAETESDAPEQEADAPMTALSSVKAPAVAASAIRDTADIVAQQVPVPVVADAASLVDEVSSDAASTDDNASTTATSVSTTSTTSNPHTSHLQALATAHAMQDVDPAMPREIRAPMNTPAWTQELGNQLTWMAQHGQEAASLRLTPEHLGPLEIRISMREGEASVWFGAAHADTRNALEQSLPRLRELFASQGLALADAGVFKEAPRQQYKPGVSSANSRLAVSEAAPAARVSSTRLGLIDTYV